MSAEKQIFTFGGGTADGDKSMKQLLGGKGANLAEMSSIGLPIPPGFTITTKVCQYYNENDQQWPEGVEEQLKSSVFYLEELMNLNFGDAEKPLLFSVRSGAAISMPGMMDTVLDLGLTDKTTEGLAKMTDNPRFAYDCYRRFIDMFGDVVMGVPHEHFEEVLEKIKAEKSIKVDADLSVDDLKELVKRYKEVYLKEAGQEFPQDPWDQLRNSINAVFGSWSSKRAKTYRKINRVTGLYGTAVNVQTMVYGNMGDDCATGVCFTRNPSTGEKELFGEFLVNAQGEDVVAGIRTPRNTSELKEIMPECYDELLRLTTDLENHYRDMQDIEFTIQQGKLYILQTRSGKRTGAAAVKIAVDLVNEGLVTSPDAIEKLVEPRHLDQLLHPQLDQSEIKPEEIIGHGLPASPGAAVGMLVFNSEEAEELKLEGKPVILARIETSPEDVGGMAASEGILTARGGMTSHAAVVARGWGKPCVAGCDDITISYDTETIQAGDKEIKKGDWISIDGARGLIILGQKSVVEPDLDDNYLTFMKWVDENIDMQVRTNADTPADALVARKFGAQGIGLCRTEHMFFGEERILPMRQMIIAETQEEREKALDKLLPFQRADFKGIFEAMEGLPVTIRLLDPPLHEFLPTEEAEIDEVAKDLGISGNQLKLKIRTLSEFNPMLGHRGCRLGITYPKITEMQTRAILEAALELKKEGKTVVPEIMIPLVGTSEEFIHQHEVIDHMAADVFNEWGDTVEYKVGTMIEIPRAALIASKIAEEAEFFSFGTNDLTQMTYGYSRDDAGKFLEIYMKEGILSEDPFQSLDTEGVGSLVSMATVNGRKANKDLKVGICGEHGGDPASVEFCYQEGLNYVSCSPFRVPIARLAVTQARLKTQKRILTEVK